MTKQTRKIALVLAAVLCFAMLFSAVLIGVEAHHDCSGSDCVICDCIHICENILKTLAAVVMLAVSLFAGAATFSYAQEHLFSCAGSATLISLKVKLSD